MIVQRAASHVRAYLCAMLVGNIGWEARWVCEQAHQQLKQELGLGDFEGRSWTGLHRHALMGCIAFTYLQHLRLKAAVARGEKAGGRNNAAATDAA